MAEKVGVEVRNPFLVLNGIGNPVTGEPVGNFTLTLARNNVAVGTPIPSVEESALGGGRYHLKVTPNQVGFFEFKIVHATYFPNGIFGSFDAIEVNERDLVSIAGLVGLNAMLDSVVTTRGKVTAFRTRSFATKVAADAAVAGESGNDGIASFRYTKALDPTDADNPEYTRSTRET